MFFGLSQFTHWIYPSVVGMCRYDLYRRNRVLGVILVLAVLLNACTASRPTEGIRVDDDGVQLDPFYQVPDVQTERFADESEPDAYGEIVTARNVRSAPHLSKNRTSQTVIALLGQAKHQQQSGYPERAAAILERALRIEPKNAQLWHRLALLRLQQGQLALAQSLAAKSNALIDGDPRLRNKNQTIIDQARILRGKIR